jgi:hypothetical protein
MDHLLNTLISSQFTEYYTNKTIYLREYRMSPPPSEITSRIFSKGLCIAKRLNKFYRINKTEYFTSVQL